MLHLRRVLRPLAVAALLCQAGIIGLVAADVLLNAGAVARTVTCICPHGDGHGPCPMHDARRDATRCRIGGTQDDGGTALLSLLTSLAMPTAAGAEIAPPSSAVVISSSPSHPIDPAFSPVAPPPRS